jgi:hypothetical protein
MKKGRRICGPFAWVAPLSLSRAPPDRLQRPGGIVVLINSVQKNCVVTGTRAVQNLAGSEGLDIDRKRRSMLQIFDLHLFGRSLEVLRSKVIQVRGNQNASITLQIIL